MTPFDCRATSLRVVRDRTPSCLLLPCAVCAREHYSVNSGLFPQRYLRRIPPLRPRCETEEKPQACDFSVRISKRFASHASWPITSIPAIHHTFTHAPLARSASTIATAPAAADGSHLVDSSPASAHAVQRKREGPRANFTGTDVAYGATEALFKECAKQADYIVPQVFERGVETPKNAHGEDIGEGTGWWYESEYR